MMLSSDYAKVGEKGSIHRSLDGLYIPCPMHHQAGLQVRSGQVWEHATKQRITVSTFHRDSRNFRLAIPQADAWRIPISLRC